MGEKGEQLGIMTVAQAMEMARRHDLDLVEVAPTAVPPVCRLLDYGKYKYELTQKRKEAKKKQATFQVKEIKLRPKTGEHDLNVKNGHIKKFLGRKDKVKVSVIFRGREIMLSGRGKELLEQITEETAEFSIVEQTPRLEGRAMVMVLGPK